MLDELPEFVQNDIYKFFLFSHFLSKFRETFTIPKPGGANQRDKNQKFYTWEDTEYRDFMMQILTQLEPRLEKAQSILIEELDEVNEIFYVIKGQVDIGYELNKSKKYVIRYQDKTVIGGYNCTFNKKAIFVYKCRSECEGYTIRKKYWLDILEEFENIAVYVKHNVEQDYMMNIKEKVFKAKKQYMQKIQRRADLQQIMTIIPNMQGNYDEERNEEINIAN